MNPSRNRRRQATVTGTTTGDQNAASASPRAGRTLPWVAAGAVPGALLRWGLARMGPLAGGAYGHDLAANLLACLVLGLLMGIAPGGRRRRLLVGVGFCGALSTFSGWIHDLQQALALGSAGRALGILAANLGLGLLALLLGRRLGWTLARER